MTEGQYLRPEPAFSADGRLSFFPQLSFSMPFRYALRGHDALCSAFAESPPPSAYLPPVMSATPPVLLVDQHSRQELLNRYVVDQQINAMAAAARQLYCVMEIPVSDWHSREVQFLRFYYRHIEPTRLGMSALGGAEPAWKEALRKILGSPWLYRYLSRQVAADGELGNSLLSQLLWNQASPKTIANYKTELRKLGALPGRVAAHAPQPAPVYALADYR